MEDKQWTKIRHERMRSDGIRDPEQIDKFVNDTYSLIENNKFSIVEALEIVKLLSILIEKDKKLILREPLMVTRRFKKEG